MQGFSCDLKTDKIYEKCIFGTVLAELIMHYAQARYPDEEGRRAAQADLGGEKECTCKRLRT